MDVALESMRPYVSPINPAVFPHLSLVLLSIGVFFMAWFFVWVGFSDGLLEFARKYEVTSTRFTRDVVKELSVSFVASLFSGFGVLFLLLWVGIYV